jgi:hypothetical protein
VVTASILDSIKQMLGIDTDDTNFDRELVIYINGALMVVNQLGVGPSGYTIADNTNKWDEFLADRTDLELVKTDIYLRVRLIFDPPQNSFLVAAIKEQITEYDWRIEINHKSEV